MWHHKNVTLVTSYASETLKMDLYSMVKLLYLIQATIQLFKRFQQTWKKSKKSFISKSDMDMGYRYLMGREMMMVLSLSMKALGTRIESMDKDSRYLLMGLAIRVDLREIKLMEWVNMNGLLVMFMRDLGRKVKWTVLVNSSTKMEEYIRGSSRETFLNRISVTLILLRMKSIKRRVTRDFKMKSINLKINLKLPKE